MKELISVNEKFFGSEKIQTVNARELHEKLKVGSRFNDWIRNRIEKYGFIEGIDFITLTKNLVSGGKQKEYYISLDMAKELCMVENNELGRMFRKYFIEVEKRYKKIQTPKLPQNYLEALKELVRVEEERQALEAENRQMKPKAEAFDELISTDGKYTMSEVAKLLNWGRNRLFKFLRMQGILRNNNEPYQEYVDRGYFKLRTYTIKHTDFEEVKVQTLVTPKGLEWIRKILKREMEFI
ncbi:hypothetical protein XO10_00480 [Marinitoga sp. 1135]|uniref:phage antirepressor KilAC domain-containing protein n=1 Tax=Marinitoga sp. 1135 TaxID=1643333 RepID=UPI0015867448|nr:hypothetical protein [Marinitoga sp. 1135]